MNGRRGEADDFKRPRGWYGQRDGLREHDRRCVRKRHRRLRMNHHHAPVVAFAAVAAGVIVLCRGRLSEAR
jgi:hypothetical protein